MNTKTGLLLLVFFVVGGSLYFNLNQSTDKATAYSQESKIDENEANLERPSFITHLKKTDISKNIVTDALNDSMKNTSVDQKAQQVIQEADLFIKEHNLTIPKKSNTSGMDHTVAAEFDAIDNMLDQMQNELENSAGE